MSRIPRRDSAGSPRVPSPVTSRRCPASCLPYRRVLPVSPSCWCPPERRRRSLTSRWGRDSTPSTDGHIWNAQRNNLNDRTEQRLSATPEYFIKLYHIYSAKFLPWTPDSSVLYCLPYLEMTELEIQPTTINNLSPYTPILWKYRVPTDFYQPLKIRSRARRFRTPCVYSQV